MQEKHSTLKASLMYQCFRMFFAFFGRIFLNKQMIESGLGFGSESELLIDIQI